MLVNASCTNNYIVIFLFSDAPTPEVSSRVHALQTKILIENPEIGDKRKRFAEALLKDPWVASFCPSNELTKPLLR